MSYAQAAGLGGADQMVVRVNGVAVFDVEGYAW